VAAGLSRRFVFRTYPTFFPLRNSPRLQLQPLHEKMSHAKNRQPIRIFRTHIFYEG